MAVSFPKAPSYTARKGEAVFVSRDDDENFVIGNGRVKIASDDILFVNGVVIDITRMTQSLEGEDVLRQGDAIGRAILIKKAEPPTEPPNAWILPDDIAVASGNGNGCGSTIFYDPSNWPRGKDPKSPSSDAILLMMLRQANLNASGKSDPSSPDWGDK
jgi:hypothetical protein